jgi:hypothetical protein
MENKPKNSQVNALDDYEILTSDLEGRSVVSSYQIHWEVHWALSM